jgi:hypothetical protein
LKAGGENQAESGDNAAIHRLVGRKQFEDIDLNRMNMLERMEMLGRQLELTSKEQERQKKELVKWQVPG